MSEKEMERMEKLKEVAEYMSELTDENAVKEFARSILANENKKQEVKE